ncbi:S1 family peptidase [Nocardioides pacificus]
MRPRLLTTFIALALTAGLTAGLTGMGGQAAAITGGTPDAEAHPNVGLTMAYDASSRFTCSATLVSPTVVLTAAHCTEGTVGRTLVTFETYLGDAPPAGLPSAADRTAGYTQAELEAAGFHSGVAHTHPGYSGLTDRDNWNDVGVIVLDRPVTDIAPARLAGVNLLDSVAQPRLNKTLFTAVGYGAEVRKPASGPQNAVPMTFPLLRRQAQMPGQKLTAQILQTNGNLHDSRGTGGTCTGDSGGPVLLGDVVVAVTSFGYNDKCRYLSGNQRVDIAPVRAWLATFGL